MQPPSLPTRSVTRSGSRRAPPPHADPRIEYAASPVPRVDGRHLPTAMSTGRSSRQRSTFPPGICGRRMSCRQRFVYPMSMSYPPGGRIIGRTARERVARRTVSLRIEKLHESIGAEITGVDLARPLADAEVAAIERAWLEHIVLVFPGQELDQEGAAPLRRPVRRAGRAFQAARDTARGRRLPSRPSCWSPTSRENGKPIGSLPDGEMWFHHDMCYVAEPYRGTMLYAIDIPSEGGKHAVRQHVRRLRPARRGDEGADRRRPRAPDLQLLGHREGANSTATSMPTRTTSSRWRSPIPGPAARRSTSTR